MEQSIGVFGKNLLLWTCLLRQIPQRPPAHVLHQQAGYLLDELKASEESRQLPVQSAEDGMFAIVALIDEVAMGLPDLRPIWSSAPLQATRFLTNNAGLEVFQRLGRVRQGPRSVLATFAVVLGLGFLGCYGLPGADRYALDQLRRELGRELGVDPDRDWSGGVLRRVHEGQVAALERFKAPWYRSVWIGRALALLFALGAAAALFFALGGQWG
ncbi:MAG: DotU family type IV/VI secretion system protein [Desulfarculus sp.]|nr:DotU family type IV/VI secretion system protein [Deltaproteobacteria bacterium]MBI4799978.1 DotU family type IV/VI secretion system protein [Desulfarculus sp.]